MSYPALRRPSNLAGLLPVAVAILSTLVVPVRSVADEPFPGPRIPRPYEEPRPLAVDSAASPPMSRRTWSKLVAQAVPRAKPKPKPKAVGPLSEPHDDPYTPKAITDIEVGIAPKPAKKKFELPIIHYSREEIAKLDAIHFSSRPVVLTRLDGRFIDQRMSGPVAPFCFLPTFFEDDSLNRFGYSHGDHIQPVLSAAQFYVSVLMLPYEMRKRCPCDPVCPNYFPPPLTFRGKARKFVRGITLDAVATEAAAVATAFLVIP